jgi:hypothetical protein
MEDPAITVAPVTDGRIALNAAATRLFEEAGVHAVKILWDKARCGIALQAARKDDANSFSIAFGGRHSQASITPKTFLKYIGWTADSRQTVRAKWDPQQKTLEAELPPRFVGMRKTFADSMPEHASELVKQVRKEAKRGTNTGL